MKFNDVLINEAMDTSYDYICHLNQPNRIVFSFFDGIDTNYCVRFGRNGTALATKKSKTWEVRVSRMSKAGKSGLVIQTIDDPMRFAGTILSITQDMLVGGRYAPERSNGFTIHIKAKIHSAKFARLAKRVAPKLRMDSADVPGSEYLFLYRKGMKFQDVFSFIEGVDKSQSEKEAVTVADLQAQEQPEPKTPTIRLDDDYIMSMGMTLPAREQWVEKKPAASRNPHVKATVELDTARDVATGVSEKFAAHPDVFGDVGKELAENESFKMYFNAVVEDIVRGNTMITDIKKRVQDYDPSITMSPALEKRFAVEINQFRSSEIMNAYSNMDTEDIGLTKLSKNQTGAIENYTKHHYQEINQMLRGVDALDTNSPYYATIELLDSVFEDIGFDAGESIPTVLYRGMTTSKDMVRKMFATSKYVVPAFMSTSMNPQIPAVFNGPSEVDLDTMQDIGSEEEINKGQYSILFIIDPKGAHAIMPGPISSFSSECEVIINRNSVFDITDMMLLETSRYSSHGRVVVYLKPTGKQIDEARNKNDERNKRKNDFAAVAYSKKPDGMSKEERKRIKEKFGR